MKDWGVYRGWTRLQVCVGGGGGVGGGGVTDSSYSAHTGRPYCMTVP